MIDAVGLAAHSSTPWVFAQIDDVMHPALVMDLGRGWYTAMMIAGSFAAAATLKRLLAWRPELQPVADSERRLGVLAGGMVGAALCGKLPWWLNLAPASTTSPAGPMAVFDGVFGDGKTILWALAGGYAGVEAAKWIVGLRQRTGDYFVVPVATAVAIGRLGCFGFGCCHGVPTELPWGVGFALATDRGIVARHPAQLYEAIFHATFASLAYHILIQKGHFRVFCQRWTDQRWMMLYLMGYCLFRFASEFWRPEPAVAGGLTLYQWSAATIGTVMLALYIRRTADRGSNAELGLSESISR